MIVGIDLGGTRIKAGLVENGRLIDSEIMESESVSGLKRQLPRIEATIDQLLTRNDRFRSDILGMGSTFPGIVDSIEMKIISTNVKYPDAPDTDLNAWVEKAYNVPFVLENDARLSLVGEWQYGAGKGVDDLVMVTLGTGIGGAAMMEGRLVRGKHFIAGCLGGHFSINYHGMECQCGNIGCVESEASSWRVPELARASPLFEDSRLSRVDVIDYKQVFTLAEERDDLALEIREKSIRAWGFGIVNMIHAYDPDRVVVSGGIIKNNAWILNRFQDIVNRHTWSPWGKAEVVMASWPEENAILGCEYLLKFPERSKKDNRS